MVPNRSDANPFRAKSFLALSAGRLFWRQNSPWATARIVAARNRDPRGHAHFSTHLLAAEERFGADRHAISTTDYHARGNERSI
jgi:hypothetical protein